MWNKEEVMKILSDTYEKWFSDENHNRGTIIGMKGSDGVLSKYSFSDLFNELMWKIETGEKY